MLRLDATGLTPESRELLREFDERARSLAGQPADLGTLDRGDREADVEDWLDDHDVADAWDLAPALVSQDLGPRDLDRLAAALGHDRLPIALALVTSAFRVHMLAHEIGQGSGRISEIVGAMKSYSYLGQAPVQAVERARGARQHPGHPAQQAETGDRDLPGVRRRRPPHLRRSAVS